MVVRLSTHMRVTRRPQWVKKWNFVHNSRNAVKYVICYSKWLWVSSICLRSKWYQFGSCHIIHALVMNWWWELFQKVFCMLYKAPSLSSTRYVFVNIFTGWERERLSVSNAPVFVSLIPGWTNFALVICELPRCLGARNRRGRKTVSIWVLGWLK